MSDTLQLGPGRFSSAHEGNFGRLRFGGFELVEKVNSIGTLIHLDGGAAKVASIPPSACSADPCGYVGFSTFGYGQVQWIYPTGKGDYLVFYTLQDDDNEIPTQTLYVSHETPTFSAVTGGEAPPMMTLQVPTGATPMSELEKACALLATCTGYTQSAAFTGCVKHFSTPSSSEPGIAAARARLIAGATSCASIKAAYPEWSTSSGAGTGCPLGCEMSGGTCTGATCSNEVAYGNGSQCGTCDPSGNYRFCSGAHMFTVACGGGTVCSSGHGCAASDGGACSAYQPNPTCTGSSLRNCDQYGLVSNQDCSLEDASCMTVSNAPTCVATTTAASCYPPTYGLQCNTAHTAVLGCPVGQIQYAACSDFGLTQCVDGAEGAYCE